MSPVGAGSAFASSFPPHVSLSLLRSFSRPALVWPLYSSRISRSSARSRYPTPPLGGDERASAFRGFPDSSLLLYPATTQRVFRHHTRQRFDGRCKGTHARLRSLLARSNFFSRLCARPLRQANRRHRSAKEQSVCMMSCQLQTRTGRAELYRR